MEILIAIILGIIEGITEFLPISSSAHITLLAEILGMNKEEVEIYAVVVQVGAVFALLWHFRREILGIFFSHIRQPENFYGIHAIGVCIIATLPAVIMGFSIKGILSSLFAPWSIAFFLFIGGIFILFAEYKTRHIQPKYTTLHSITYRSALYVGLFQCLSLFSGFSRSTATVMGAMLVGFSRTLAVKFSFIIAIPILSGASLLQGFEMRREIFTLIAPLSISCFVAFCTSLISISILLRYLEKHSFTPFAIYRIILSIILLTILL